MDDKSITQTTTTEEKSNIPSYAKEAAVQTLQVKYKDWKCNTAIVSSITTADIQSSGHEELYHVNLKLRKPHIVFKTIANNDGALSSAENELATVNFHAFSSKIDVTINDQPIELKPSSFKNSLKGEYTYSSPALGEKTLTWKLTYDLKSVSYVCLDEKMLPLARFTSDAWVKSWKTVGRLEFLGAAGEDRKFREEIVVVGLTLAYLLIT